MSDTVTRWECAECGRSFNHGPGWVHDESPCPGIPVERVYVAVDALLSDAAIAATEREYLKSGLYTRGALRAAIDAVTGGTA